MIEIFYSISIFIFKHLKTSDDILSHRFKWSDFNCPVKIAVKSGRWWPILWFAAAWKLLAIFNIKNAFIEIPETSLRGVILPEKSIARIRIEKKWPLGGQNRYILKIASLFQAAANHSSGHQRSLFLTDLESKFHELFKNAIKRLNFEWHGG